MATTRVYKKAEKSGVVYGMDMKTPAGRLIWNSLDKAKPGMKFDDGKQGAPAFVTNLVLDINDATKAFMKVVKEEVGKQLEVFNKGEKVKISDPQLYKTEDDFDLEKYPFLKGKIVIAANKKEARGRPVIVNKAKEDISGASVEGGMLGRLVIAPYVHSKGVAYQLSIVQVLDDDGTRFGGSSNYSEQARALLDDDEPKASEEVKEEAHAKGKGKKSSLDDL